MDLRCRVWLQTSIGPAKLSFDTGALGFVEPARSQCGTPALEPDSARLTTCVCEVGFWKKGRLRRTPDCAAKVRLSGPRSNGEQKSNG
jgi:hypothetical protein